MAWVDIGGKASLYDGTNLRGYVHFEYDDTSGNPRSCRLRIESIPNTSFTVNFNNITVDGINRGSQSNLNQNSGTFWTGTVDGGKSVTASWTNPWYAGTKYPSVTGNLPSAGSAPSGCYVTYHSSTWESVSFTAGMTATGDANQIHACVITGSSNGAVDSMSNWDIGRWEWWYDGTTNASHRFDNCKNSNSDANYQSPIAMKGLLHYKLGWWMSNPYGNTSGFNSTLRYLPPAPLATLSYTQTQGATNVTVNVTITGADSTKNYSDTVTTYYRYSTNGGSTYSSWTSAGTGTPWTSKTASFTCAYKANVVIQAKQTYHSMDSEVKSVSFTATSGTAPSSLSSSITASTWNSVTMNGSASYGNPSGISGRSLTVGVNINGTSLANRRELNTQNVTSVSGVVINNSSSNLGGAFDLKGMLPVYPFAWASNTVQSASSIGSVHYLPPAPGSLTYTTTASGSDIVCALNYVGVAADNDTSYTAADLTRTVRYKGDEDADWTYIENGTQIALTTVTTQSLTIAATHNVVVEAWMTYKGKNSDVSTVTVVNNNDPVNLYASVNGVTTKVIKLYASANNETVKVKKLYGSVNGVARLVYEDNS